ncbi:MAG: hypothetical protein HY321_06990 [Armatimonadetes bacterium]|nr:hypothetical protein [Armatimonadota bacterium]
MSENMIRWSAALAALAWLTTSSAPAEGAGEAQARLDAREGADSVAVDTGAIRFELGRDGTLRSLEVGGKPVVRGNRAPFLAATLFESESCDGWRDQTPGTILEGRCEPATHAFAHRGGVFRARLEGRLVFPGDDRMDYVLTLEARAGSPFLTLSTRLAPDGAFRSRFLRSASLRLPLALNKRKRVVQGGDRGVQWDTRHWYQFHFSRDGVMPEPEHNIWRTFAIDQETPSDYHVWRSESTVTPPLSMQRGLQAPGWIAAYDQRAGLLFAYRGFTDRAPKSLRVEADGAGEADVHFWHESLPALDLRSPRAAAVFGEAHVTEWIAFDGEFDAARPDAALARHWGVPGLASDPPQRNEVPCGDINLLDAPAADADAPLVSGGVPFPRGVLTDPTRVRLRRDGADVPLQTRTLGWWPDHSIKWLLLTFPADGGEVSGAAGEGSSLTFQLTRRDESRSPYRLDYGAGVRMGAPRETLRATRTGDSVAIDTGPLRLEVTKGPGWLKSARLNGREMLGEAGGRSFVDFLRPQAGYVRCTTHAQGRLDDGGFVPERVDLEESGPLRATVRLEGYTTSEEPARVIVRLEAHAGRSVVRVFQSVEFLHKDPRVAFVRGMGLRLAVASTADARVAVGAQKGPLALAPGARAGLKQHSHLGYTAWHQVAGERFLRLDETAHRSRGWLDLSGPQGGVAVVLRDMWQQFPNELVADAPARELTAYFWPESGSVMDTRRYSNYPHPAQGEAAIGASTWIDDTFYPRLPMVGVSKTHEVLLYFHGPRTSGARIDAVAADVHRPPLVYAGAKWYQDAGVVLPPFTAPDPARFPRADANLEHHARFRMHHQKLWGWYGLWDYGDIGHYFRGGAGSIIPPDALVQALAAKSSDPERPVVIPPADRVRDYVPNHDWAFDNGRWGWGNTEGMPGLYVQTQYLRTGDRDLYFFTEAMSRHERDVDMRHDGTYLGRGTRHGVQHWSDGNHEERQTAHSEFRYLYGLSGDLRYRDFAKLLFERVYSQKEARGTADHSGRLQGLLTWWEMTGDDDVARMLEKYIRCFIVDQGICEDLDVRFPDVTRVRKSDHVAHMFFWYFGAGHGVLEYYYLTKDKDLRDALIRRADLHLKRRAAGEYTAADLAILFAAREAPDPEPYRKALLTRGTSVMTPSIWAQMVPHNPAFYGGPRSFLSSPEGSGWMIINDVFYLLAVLGKDPELSEAQWAAIREKDEHGGPPYVAPKLSWQSEYDRPELEEYLRIKHPQP